MGELIDFAAYKKQKEEEEIEDLMKQVEVLMSQYQHEALPYYKLNDPRNVGDFYGAPIYPPSLDGYNEWWGTEDEFSYYPDYGEED